MACLKAITSFISNFDQMKSTVFFKRGVVLIMLFFLFDYLISQFLINGLNRYYGIDGDAEILINGSSISMSGFNRIEMEQLTQKKVANYSHEGVTIEERLAMINHFFSENSEGAESVIFEVTPILFSDINLAENIYTIFFPYMGNRAINDYIKEKAPKTDYCLHKTIKTSRFDARLLNQVIRGYLGTFQNFKNVGLETNRFMYLTDEKGTVPIVMNPTENRNI